MKEHMLQELERIVRCAGDMVREAHDIEQVTTEKNGAADLVTKYDVAVQGFLKRELLTLLPEADFFGEEGDHAKLTQPAHRPEQSSGGIPYEGTYAAGTGAHRPVRRGYGAGGS